MKVRSDSSVAGDSATSAIWTLLSRITGLGRVILIGATLGPSYFGNLFQLGNQLPWITFDLAIGALLGSLLVPALVRHINADDVASVQRVAGGFLGLVMLAFGGIAAVVMLLSGAIAELFALPIPQGEVRSQFVSAAVPLLLLTAPQLVGYGVAITGQAVQHAMGHYKIPAAASIIENLTVIATLLFFGFRFGRGLDIADVSAVHMLVLGGGSSLGVGLHAGLQMWGVRRLGLRVRPRAGWKDDDVKALIRQALPTSGTAFLNGSRLLMLLVVSNTVPGGVVAFQLALNVLNVPVALGAKPVVHALLPRLASSYQAGDLSEFADRYFRGIGFASLVTIPAAAAAASLGWLVSIGVAVGEMNTDSGRTLLAYGVAGVAGAIVGDGLYHLATASSYSRLDAQGPLRAQILRVALTAAGSAATLLIADGVAVILGIAIAMSLADVAAGLYLHHRVAKVLPRGNYRLANSLAGTAVCSAAGFGLVATVALWLRQTWQIESALSALTLFACLAAIGLSVFGGLRYRFDGEVAELVDDARGSPRKLAEAAT